jgi:DNA mismatch repair protein MutS2
MAPARFQIGDRVLIRSLKRAGTVAEVLRDDSFRVALGSLTIVVSARELELPPPSETSQDKTKIEIRAASRGLTVPKVLDLHGMTVADAVSRLEAWLNSCILAGHGNVKVVHGLGTGRVQHATHEVLRRYSAVRAFRINDLNPGETDVFLA